MYFEEMDVDMKNRRSRIAVGLLALVLGSLVGVGTAMAQDGAAARWENAAENRESTAVALQKQASELLARAADLRSKDYLYETERQQNLSRAGDAEFKAAGIEETAATNYDRAAANWMLAVDEHARMAAGEAANEARIRAELAGKNAREARHNAMVNYEAAAKAYDADHAGEPDKRQAALAGANRLREQLESNAE